MILCHIKDSYLKLCKVLSNLIVLHNSEFLAQLVHQATNNKSRYKPVSHQELQIGDIVLLKEPLQKPASFLMGIVREVKLNSSIEVMGVTLQKGNGEKYRNCV